jgi:MurNAc alpha-1-phosphate uridylyltransferase
MKAIILSAGLGTRMRPLTDHTPKPLLKAGGQYLIAYHLQKLRAAGIRDIVINTHWLSDTLMAALGTGEKWDVRIYYSHEPVLLETAGGIAQALPLLVDGDSPFLVVNGDIYTELDFSAWLAQQLPLTDGILASLVLVPNPDHHPAGDFVLSRHTGLIKEKSDANGEPALTYSGIGLYHPDFFAGIPAQPMKLAPLLHQFIAEGKVIGTECRDYWLDVGTPERLGELEQRLHA